MKCPISHNNCHELVEKYPFVSSINVECVDKNKSHTYMDATLVLDTTPLPQDFYELKLDIYNIVREKTNKTPIARTGWRILKSDKN
jgi:hypothetical protein